MPRIPPFRSVEHLAEETGARWFVLECLDGLRVGFEIPLEVVHDEPLRGLGAHGERSPSAWDDWFCKALSETTPFEDSGRATLVGPAARVTRGNQFLPH